LYLERALYRHDLRGFVVSVRGYIFDFGRVLSAATQSLVEPAVQQILQLI